MKNDCEKRSKVSENSHSPDATDRRLSNVMTVVEGYNTIDFTYWLSIFIMLTAGCIRAYLWLKKKRKIVK